MSQKRSVPVKKGVEKHSVPKEGHFSWTHRLIEELPYFGKWHRQVSLYPMIKDKEFNELQCPGRGWEAFW